MSALKAESPLTNSRTNGIPSESDVPSWSHTQQGDIFVTPFDFCYTSGGSSSGTPAFSAHAAACNCTTPGEAAALGGLGAEASGGDSVGLSSMALALLGDQGQSDQSDGGAEGGVGSLAGLSGLGSLVSGLGGDSEGDADGDAGADADADGGGDAGVGESD